MMAEQQQAEVRSVLQRLRPVLDVLGAVLIFGSWIASNTLSQRAGEQAAIHQGIVDRVRQFRLYEDFARSIVEIQSDLARTGSLVEYLARQVKSSEGNQDPPRNAPVWTGMTALQVRETNDLLSELEQYATRLPISGDIPQSIERAGTQVQAVTEAFHSARDRFEQIVEATEPASEQSADVVAAEEKLQQRVDRLWADYDAARQSMLRLGDELVDTASQQSETASRRAAAFQRLSYVLYVVGTLIILLGRIKGVFETTGKAGR